MAYKPDQLPFIEYNNWVNEVKRAHDMGGGGYPLFIEVFDTQGQKLIEQIIKNVYDRKSQPQNVATEDWSPPLTVRKTEQRIPVTMEFPIDCEIRIPDCVPGDQLSISSLYTDEEAIQFEADLKECRRQDAADTRRREKDLEAEIELKNAK